MTYLLAFVGGFAGSGHCLAMCGGFTAILAGAGVPGAWRRLALYNLGRLNTLAMLGAAGGALGTAVVGWGPLETAERALAVVTGLIAVVVGLEAVGLIAPRGRWVAARFHAGLGRHVRALLHAPSPWAPLAFGTVNAFLPCHLIYAFAALAAATGSVVRGALVMLAFGCGTVPAMMLAGSARRLVPTRFGGRLARAAGGLVVAVGLLTMARGLGGAHALPHP